MTRKSIVVLIVLIGEVLAGAANAAAQSALLNLPDVSQHARITQRIGLTDVTIDYHRPLARGRKIFGGLQRTDKSGAREPTTTRPSSSPTRSASTAIHSRRAPTAST